MKSDMRSYKKNIVRDIHDEYTFSTITACPSHTIFYDEDEKVAELNYAYTASSPILEIQGFELIICTEKQVNLFFDLQAEVCFIHSNGPLCLDGKYVIAKELMVHAESLNFYGTKKCNGHIKLKSEKLGSQKSIILEGDMTAKSLVITAKFLEITNSSLAVQEYISIKSALKIDQVTIAANSLSLQNNTSILNSRLKIKQRLNAECSLNIIHSTIFCEIILLKNQVEFDQVNVKAKIFKLATTTCHIKKLAAKSRELYLQGGTEPDTAFFEDCRLEAERIALHGHLCFSNKSILVSRHEDMIHTLSASLKLLDGSSFVTKGCFHNLYENQLELDNSTLKADFFLSNDVLSNESSIEVNSMFQYKNIADLTKSHLQVKNSLLINKKSRLSLKNSRAEAKELLFSGEVKSSASEIESDSCDIYADIEIQESKITANNFSLYGTVTIPQFPRDKASTINVKQDFSIKKTATIQGGGSLMLNANNFSNHGKITHLKKFIATGNSGKNYHLIDADEIFLGYNFLLSNQGTVSAKNLQISTPIFMALPLSQIFARGSYTLASILNLGFLSAVFANNINTNSLLNINASLVLPNLFAASQYIVIPVENEKKINKTNELQEIYYDPIEENNELNQGDKSEAEIASQYLLIWNNFIELAKIAAIAAIAAVLSPKLGISINILFRLEKLFYTLYENFDRIKHFFSYKAVENSITIISIFKEFVRLYWRDSKNFCWHDWLNDKKEKLTSLGIDFSKYNQKNIYEFLPEITKSVQNIKLLYFYAQLRQHISEEWKQASSAPWWCNINMASLKKITTSTMKTFVSNNDNSLVHINLCSLDGDKNTLSLIYSNLGADISFSKTITAFWLENKGFSAFNNSQLNVYHYQDNGYSYGNSLTLLAKSANLYGNGNISTATIHIENYANYDELIAGSGSFIHYTVSDTLSITIPTTYQQQQTILRDCHLIITARDITWNSAYHKPYSITLISSINNIELTNNLQPEKLWVQSAGKLITQQGITAKVACIDISGDYINYGYVYSDDLTIKASSITNHRGVIHGANAYLTATQANIENNAGIIRGNHFLRLTAKNGEIANKSMKKTIEGSRGYGQQTTFISGTISGGDGQGRHGVGLVMQGNSINNDAAHIMSKGTNILQADTIHFGAEEYSHITSNDKKLSLLGMCLTHTQESILSVKVCTIFSENGTNIILANHLTAEAPQFVSKNGNEFDIKQSIQAKCFTVTARRHQSTDFIGTMSIENHSAQQTVAMSIDDDGHSVLHLANSDINIPSLAVGGKGGLDITAANGKVLLGGQVLTDHLSSNKYTAKVSNPVLDALTNLINTDNFGQSICIADELAAKTQQLLASKNVPQGIVNALNCSIESINIVNSVARGIANDNISNEIWARYSLGGTDGFAPMISTSIAQSDIVMTMQHLDSAGIKRSGNVTIKSSKCIDIQQGYVVRSDHDMEFDAPILKGKAAELHVKKIQSAQGGSLSINLITGMPQSASIFYSQSESETIHHANADIHANGHLRMHNSGGAMENIQLEGLNISANTAEIKARHLQLIANQDSQKSSSMSFGIGTTGHVSGYYGHDNQQKTIVKSSIEIKESNRCDTLQVEYFITDQHSKIETKGKNTFNNTRVINSSKDQMDIKGFGFSGNVNDVNNLFDMKPSNTAGEKAISTPEIMVNFQINNKPIHLNVTIPATNRERLQASQNNFQAAKEKLVTANSNFFFPERELPIFPMLSSFIYEDITIEQRRIAILIDIIEKNGRLPLFDIKPLNTIKNSSSQSKIFNPKLNSQKMGLKNSRGSHPRFFSKETGRESQYTNWEKEVLTSTKKNSSPLLYREIVFFPIKNDYVNGKITYDPKKKELNALAIISFRKDIFPNFHSVDHRTLNLDKVELGKIDTSLNSTSIEVSLKPHLQANRNNLSAAFQAEMGFMLASANLTAETAPLYFMGLKIILEGECSCGYGFKTIMAAGAELNISKAKGSIFYKVGQFDGIGFSCTSRIICEIDERFSHIFLQSYQEIIKKNPASAIIFKKLEAGEQLTALEARSFENISAQTTIQTIIRAHAEKKRSETKPLLLSANLSHGMSLFDITH